ncbi:hypothetical protein HYDPIDRAFT_84512, partial [Hydnomerulius pinastri MD-312]
VLLLMLALAAIGTSIGSLVLHEHPSPSDASLIIAASTMVIMFFLWIPKRHLARARGLNSSTMHGEALCSLSCMQLSAVLLVGSLIYRVWRGGWWVDSVTAIVIALLFGWEGINMVRWARDKDFNGGCCAPCSKKEGSGAIASPEVQNDTEMQRLQDARNPAPGHCTSCCE